MRTLTYLLAWLVLAIPCSAKIIYVDADAAGANDGSSWADAYNYLQDALFNASSGAEIQVAEGIYKPHLNSYSLAPVSRADTFRLKNGVTIKGGYAGFGEPDPDVRDIGSYVSILSGDMNGNDAVVGSPEELLTEPTRADNSYHVVTAIGVDANAVLDGFSITGGQANGGTYEFTWGGGIYNSDASPTVKGCTFGANSAADRGGGMYIFIESSRPTLSRCTFTFNHAVAGGGIMSYGVPTLTNCVFIMNTGIRGGGMWSSGGELSRCVFSGNRSVSTGGGIFMSYDTSMTSCMLSGNSADRGGAVFAEDCDITVTGCTIIGNRARYVGGIHNDEGKTFVSSCILWGNMDADGEDESAQIDTEDPPSVNYCCVQGWTGGLGGTGNISANPAFVQPGHWDTTGAWVEGDYHLLVDSVCVNAGDPNYIAGPNEMDLDGNARVLCGRIDMGAYEFGCPKVVYVDVDATGNNDGRSWTDAYNRLQDGLASACEGDEIRVARGVYKPDQGGGNTSGDREATFQLKDGVLVKGGYAGFGEPDPDAKDTRDFVTILSGDIGIAGDISDNSYRVVMGSGTDATAVLDGFTVTASCGERPDECGGVYNRFGSPTVANCTFIDNWALYGYSGNGMYNRYGNPTVTNCIFNGSGRNNGMFNSQSDLTITNCVFIRNRQCGIESYGGSLILTNCLFGDNDWALFIDYCDPIIRNCTFSRNNRAIEYDGGATAALTNCIVWENTEPFYADTINYSCVQGSWDTGTGNITEDPLFVDASNGDYHLLEDSPCIDAGDPNYLAEPNETDLDGGLRVIGGRIDMGAYEFRCLQVLYVDADATGNNDGRSWTDAYNRLQDALAAACNGGEIRVARGVYKPDQGGSNTVGDREATFQLKDGVAVKGGFAGFGEPGPDARDICLYETVLSGDLNGDDVAVNDPCDLPAEPTKAENSYHVVTGTGTDETAILDGFTITGGNANGPHDPYRFEWGGGMYCNLFSSPTVINCTFRGNMAIGGGGLYIYWDNNMVLTNCAFIGNYAGSGGGMEAMRSRVTLTNCAFSGNAAQNGGGMCNQDGGPTLTSCTFSANSAVGNGGGIVNFMSSPTLINCTLTGNRAERGGAINSFLECTTVVTNSILWANTAAQGSQICLEDDPHYSSDASISYCNVEGGITGVYVGEGWRFNWGQGNIDSDPLFRDPDGNDNIPGTEDDNLRLSAASQCIDAGDPDYLAEPNETDLDGRPRVIGGRIDMGAYELGLPPIEVEMKLVPQAINPGSKGKWVKAHFVLPEGYTIEDVDTSRPAEIEQFQIKSEYMDVFVNNQDLVEIMAAFDRSAFCGIGPFEGEIAVVGYLRSGQKFRGTDTIKIVRNKIKHLAVVASNWLSVCSGPDWCDGADLDQDTLVNFVDVALIDGCCFEVLND